MTTYKPHSLIAGYKIDRRLTGYTIVAVPEKKFLQDKKVEVINGYSKMVVDKEQAIKVIGGFKDKFNDNEVYSLYYFIWQPQESQLTIS